MKLSPMMQQYLDIKDKYPDDILFFRLGDFYEMFFDDAKLVSKLLELTLTGRNCGLEERAPMCGVPFHAADTYIAKLVEMGYRVAICEQLEDPAEVKGMVKRGVVKVVTPGTVTSGAILHERENNYLASAYLDDKAMSVSYCDISTGEMRTTEKTYGSALAEDLINELVKIGPKEMIVNASFAESYGEEKLRNAAGAFVNVLPDSYYTETSAKESLRAQFGGMSLTALGLDGRTYSILSAGALAGYLLETQMQSLGQITNCVYYETGSTMALDRSTIRNLEITETLYDKQTRGSLLGVLDRTGTAMGARKMKQWLRQPLNDKDQINRRLDAVEELTDNPLILNDIREALKDIYDFERLSGRIASGNANGRDLKALRDSIAVIPEIRSCLEDMSCDMLEDILAGLPDLGFISDMIDRSLVEDPPVTIKEGGLIRSGFSEELDGLKDSIRDAKTWIAGLENAEKERTGITHLKVGFNKVFGYYIEVTRSNLDMVPDDYIRKQTLVGAERFITPKLKEMEGLVLNAETRINKLEYEIFTALREEIALHIAELQQTSRSVSELDVIASFAYVGNKNGYVRPSVDDSFVIEIEKGRHPVIEQMQRDGLFVSNDTYMDNKDSSMLIITGPNMSGKSTYMRQTALIVLMAQTGCFVPAEKARIGIVDRIFTRIGASDNLAQGQSTFFVEMSELAYILRNSKERSLIILDEIGRGTSTYDGLSIAWAAVEYLCKEDRRIRTLFATHYHELTVLEDKLDGVRNLNVDVSEEGGDIVFLHKIVPGPANRSYGIHVARLAGVPLALLQNAETKLERFASMESSSSLRDAFSASNKPEEPRQISFFDTAGSDAVRRLREIDIMEVTPSQAIRILEELKEMLD
ncbi:MAG: DNA mismatch repair protein MutS [Eubacterium sp.]|nr:DNA mismatch repair protein MutS [Eubacterium sp.]